MLSSFDISCSSSWRARSPARGFVVGQHARWPVAAVSEVREAVLEVGGLRAAHTETQVTSEDRTTRRVCSMHPTRRPASEIELSVDREAAAPPPRSRRPSRPSRQPH